MQSANSLKNISIDNWWSLSDSAAYYSKMPDFRLQHFMKRLNAFTGQLIHIDASMLLKYCNACTHPLKAVDTTPTLFYNCLNFNGLNPDLSPCGGGGGKINSNFGIRVKRFLWKKLVYWSWLRWRFWLFRVALPLLGKKAGTRSSLIPNSKKSLLRWRSRYQIWCKKAVIGNTRC